MALGGGNPAGGLNSAAVRHVVVLERQRVGDQPSLGVVWGELRQVPFMNPSVYPDTSHAKSRRCLVDFFPIHAPKTP